MTTDAIGKKLKRPRSRSCAAQCREMGVVVGDTIVGRETYANGDWSEVKLTVLFIGRDKCVFETERRNNYSPRWIGDGESADWALECRDWYKEPAP